MDKEEYIYIPKEKYNKLLDDYEDLRQDRRNLQKFLQKIIIHLKREIERLEKAGKSTKVEKNLLTIYRDLCARVEECYYE